EQSLRDAVTEVSDEELQAAYEAQVSENEDSYTDGSSFESDMTGESAIVCWMPEGYRTVKHILLMPEDELKTAYTDAVSALEDAQSDLDDLQAELDALNDDDTTEEQRSAEEIEADIAAAEETVAAAQSTVEAAERACLNNVKDKTTEIYARLEAGEDFADLIAEYGEDPGMQNEPTASRGYYVSAASVNWEVNFRDAAMSLENVGDYTLEPVVSGSGVHIIRYESDVTAGPVALDEVRDALYEQTLTEKQEANVTDTIDAWVEAANPVVDVEAFEAAYTGEE
ncbi:MAG: peptidylprolyl isomerase, partial [Aristaeellaceae bacterium]